MSQVVEAEQGSAAPSRAGRALWAGADRLTQAVAVLVALQVAAVIVFGAITIQKYPLWSLVDEGAHFNNVIYVAAHGSYPVLGKTLANDQELAISQGIYPRHTTINARTAGLTGLAYEAFQPPLYYYVAAPVSLLSGNYHTKGILLRYFGLFLLAVAIALFARLCRHVLGRRWLYGLAAGMLDFLMPGVIARMVTISDIQLAIPIAVLILTELWIAWERQSWRRLPWCGALVGLGMLTDLYLTEFAVLYAVVAGVILLRNRRPQVLAWVTGGGVLAAVVLLPWLVFNEAKYHAVTATSIAKQEQLSTVNPDHVHYAVSQLPGFTFQFLFQPLMPQEWGDRVAGHAVFSYGATLFQVLLIPAAFVLAIGLWKRVVSSSLWILLVPFVVNVALCWYIDVGQQWFSGSMPPRYILPTLAPLLLFSVAAVCKLFRAVRPLALTLAASTAFLVVLWIHVVPTIHATIHSA